MSRDVPDDLSPDAEKERQRIAAYIRDATAGRIAFLTSKRALKRVLNTYAVERMTPALLQSLIQAAKLQVGCEPLLVC
jgi:predicted outer membrane protein